MNKENKQILEVLQALSNFEAKYKVIMKLEEFKPLYFNYKKDLLLRLSHVKEINYLENTIGYYIRKELGIEYE